MLRKHPEIDTIVIATPSGMHFEHGMEMMEGYRKNIVVEKPTFMRPSHVRDAYSQARRSAVHVFPVFQNRFNKAVQRVKSAITSGELGKIRIASVRVRWCRPQRYYDLAPWRGTYAMDGGALTNQGVHHLDLLRYLGGEVKSVTAQMRTYGANIEVEDTAVATIQFQNGAVGNLEVTTAARPDDFEASISLVCENGLAQIGGIAVNELQVFTPKPDDCKTFSEDFSRNVYGHGHNELYASLARTLQGKAQYIISEDDCYKSISLLHAFYQSAAEHRNVEADDRALCDRLGEPDENLANLYRIHTK
jgi:UDP-N-acetyl-2-amino-2-deoxyglucuronate dehydrogenase